MRRYLGFVGVLIGALLLSLVLSPLTPLVPSRSAPNSIAQPLSGSASPIASPTATPTASPAPTPVNTSYQAIDEFHRPRFSVEGDQVFAAASLPQLTLEFNETDLLTVLQNTRAYFQTYSDENPDVQRSGILATQGVTLSDVVNTLDFMIATLEEDINNAQPLRLKDPAFINRHFKVMQWSAYDPENLSEQRLRLTKYAVFTHPGSRSPTAVFDVPLYQLSADADTDRFYLNYTKQEVLAGVYAAGSTEAGRVEPLAYLTRESFEDALMQGTILVNFTDGTSAFFNVDRNNGIAYDPNISPYQQGRYWYFKPVDAIKGYGHTSEAKISIEPDVTFAGDVLNIGLGRIVVLEHDTTGPQLHLGMIADTGGAFLPNLHQLDLLAGVFGSRDEFYAHVSQFPEYAKAYILVKTD